MITVKEALNRLDTKQSYTLADRLSAMARAYLLSEMRDTSFLIQRGST